MTIEEFVKFFQNLLPEHKCDLHLEHNPCRSYYETVAEWDNASVSWISEEQKVKAYVDNEVWVLQWYPRTPIGSYTFAAHDLTELLLYCKEI